MKKLERNQWKINQSYVPTKRSSWRSRRRPVDVKNKCKHQIKQKIKFEKKRNWKSTPSSVMSMNRPWKFKWQIKLIILFFLEGKDWKCWSTGYNRRIIIRLKSTCTKMGPVELVVCLLWEVWHVFQLEGLYFRHRVLLFFECQCVRESVGNIEWRELVTWVLVQSSQHWQYSFILNNVSCFTSFPNLSVCSCFIDRELISLHWWLTIQTIHWL